MKECLYGIGMYCGASLRQSLHAATTPEHCSELLARQACIQGNSRRNSRQHTAPSLGATEWQKIQFSAACTVLDAVYLVSCCGSRHTPLTLALEPSRLLIC